jgi:hypothetical protein
MTNFVIEASLNWAGLTPAIYITVIPDGGAVATPESRQHPLHKLTLMATHGFY